MKKGYAFLTLLVSLILLLLMSCGTSVKKGYWRLDNSIKVGQAFDNYQYFTGTKWKSFKDDQGRKITQVTGKIDMKKAFITDTYNLLEGDGFENYLLDILMKQANMYENNGTDIVSEGDWKDLLEMVQMKNSYRNPWVVNLVKGYEQHPEGVVINATGRLDDWVRPREVPEIKDEHRPIVEAFAAGDFKKAAKLYDELAGWLTNDLKGVKGSYTCQFTVDANGVIQFYSGLLSLTMDVEGAKGVVTFDLPESSNDIPFAAAVYDNVPFVN